ncbi:Peptidyl-prolyl cis-trans isomerase-like 3 [Zancudomyces culisetae]|uniref:Peptidyl-prolyl cis-trans isomerase n=1 Tax=Zancudomyces culisetae TaxID=1213189 RepID=A0A1R1PU63_ZANCU|nr:Peptidyl-prolyl cis-trans isomerase-like 3 [Zancudomyces culisetae]|eukprot:OMH84459.1 Peptidyl-prolyl cis-trans isomerase-like 3 [Zancudomyces culisetae]
MGDPSGTGKGGISIWGNKYQDEIRGNLTHDKRGVVSMANSGPDTNGSQFFITYDKQPSLDSKYTIFGRVIDEENAVLYKLESVEVDDSYRPVKDIHVKSVTIHANPIADKV